MLQLFNTIGALTAKPHAFRSRSWELRIIYTIDFFDSMCSNIQVEIRGTTGILRVLPRINELINKDFMTNKIRFTFYCQ